MTSLSLVEKKVGGGSRGEEVPFLPPRDRAARAQRQAADPAVSAWVGASAGSGKTKVLTDRVLRLLLVPEQRPERILCLTFTKAAAAEMATRLAKRLGEWAVLPADRLDAALASLGVAPDAATRARARSLFAQVLDLPGGMRIATVHAFCQSLLRAFPLEAALPPRFAVLEDADAQALRQEAREAVLAVEAGAVGPIAALVNAEDFAAVVRTLDDERDALATLDPGSMAEWTQRLGAVCGLDATTNADAVIAAHFDGLGSAVGQQAAGWHNHKIKTARESAAAIREFLTLDRASRAARWLEWCDLFQTGKGEDRKHLMVDAFAAEQARIRATQTRLCDVELRDGTLALLELALPMLRRYAAAKSRAGLLDYDDLIAAAKRVLNDPGSAWVLFKLDGGLDHVLLDEAQDTNPAQWSIAEALTDEFFSGLGADRSVARTVFAVGDVKQSIYGFQGADPAGFERYRAHFAERVEAAEGVFATVPLDVSFRSTAPILALVDAVFADGAARNGVVDEGATLEHFVDRTGQAGRVELWPLLRAPEPPKAPPLQVPEVPVEASDAATLLAEALAARIAAMIGNETLPARGRVVRAGDILVLVRKRTAFNGRLVRALKRRGVAVGGLDRLKLVDEIAVADLLALCDVLLLPEDDLALAALLRSPLGGLTDDDLFALAWQRPGSLWSRLLAARGGATRAAAVAEWLTRLADRADLVTPHALLVEILTEPSVDGTPTRARLLARLGPDAAEPIDEVLNAALAYQRRHPPSLQGFVHWLRRGGAEVKREPDAAGDAVRIMTVHNAKGLQAPVVVLADVGPGGGRDTLLWTAEEPKLPLWAPNKACHGTAFRDAREAATARSEAEESRLLYVALTRAEDSLIVCGWRARSGPNAKLPGWHGLVRDGFARLDGVVEAPFDPADFGAPMAIDIGGAALLTLATPQSPGVATIAEPPPRGAVTAILPDWAHRPAPPEATTTALRPSALPGEAAVGAAPPHGAADPTGQRFRRGRLVHALLQHLPNLPPAERAAAGAKFLARPGHALPADERAAILAEALALLEAPALAAAFAPGTLAEAPIAGRIGGIPIVGQVDRLAIGPDRVLVVDFKTNRPPPAAPDAVPPLYLRQMAAYRAVLRQAFPGRAIDSVLVWTYGARAMVLPDDLLDRHEPA